MAVMSLVHTHRSFFRFDHTQTVHHINLDGLPSDQYNFLSYIAISIRAMIG